MSFPNRFRVQYIYTLSICCNIFTKMILRMDANTYHAHCSLRSLMRSLVNEWKSYIIIPKWCKSAKSRQEYSIRAFKEKKFKWIAVFYLLILPRGISRLHGLFFSHSMQFHWYNWKARMTSINIHDWPVCYLLNCI